VIGHSHAIIGASAGVIVAHVLQGDALAGALLGGVAGLVPDIDAHGTTLGRYIPGWVPRPGHRGPTHSILFCAALAAAAYGARYWLIGGPPTSWLVSAAVLAGALSHLAADAVTDRGVPILWPLTQEHFGLPWPLSFKTGTWPEHIIVLGVIAGTIGWTYNLTRVWTEVSTNLAAVRR
jgi:inner membrane protein